MSIRFPSALRPGSVIAVTAPSSGIDASMRPRFEFCKQRIEARGFSVEVGTCLESDGIVSAPAQVRARELQGMMTSARVSLVMPPWGGELLIHLLELLDFDEIARAEAPWFAGWSDGSTLALPLLFLSNCASLHGLNFMDSAFLPATGIAAWWDVLSLQGGGAFTQTSLAAHQRGFKDYRRSPELETWEPTEPSRWRRLGTEGSCELRGRLVGGCIDTIARLIGTRFGDLPRFARERAPEGLVLFLENCEMPAADACRALHQMRLAGWFERANGVLIGRTKGGPTNAFTQKDAIADALGGLDIPVLYDVDISHVPPQHMIINGASACVRYEPDGRATIEQSLV